MLTYIVAVVVLVLRVFFVVSDIFINHDGRLEIVAVIQVELFHLPLAACMDVNKDRELLAEASKTKHVVPGVPVNIGHDVIELAVVFSGRFRLLVVLIPDMRSAFFAAGEYEAPVSRQGKLDLLVAAFGAKEPSLDGRAAR